MVTHPTCGGPHHVWPHEGNAIPEFDPVQAPHQTIDLWLARIDQTATAYGWSERTTINLALSKLKGPAKLWYEGLEAAMRTWDEWKSLLREWFPSVSTTQKLYHEMEQRVRRPGEAIESYYHDKVAKARRCGLTERGMVDYLITGLNDSQLIMTLSTREYETPQELLKSIKQTEERLELAQVRLGKQTYRTSTNNNKRNPVMADGHTEGNAAKNTPPKRGLIRKPKFNEQGEPLCFNCSEYGHLSKDCPKPQRKDRCASCHRTTHKTADCGLKGASAGQAAASAASGRTDSRILCINDTGTKADANDKYFKEASINGQAVKSYVDLGSRCMTVTQSTARQLGLVPQPKSPSCTITGYGSGQIDPVGQVTAEVVVDQVRANIELLVVPDHAQGIPLLIGQPLTELPNVTIVKRQGTLRLFQEAEPALAEDGSLRNLNIPKLPVESVNLWTKNATVIPPKYVGFVEVCVRERDIKNCDLFVDMQVIGTPGFERCIPRSVNALDGNGCTVLPITNISDRELCIMEGQKMVRADICREIEQDGGEKYIGRVDVQEERKPLEEDEINIDSSVEPETRRRLCDLLNRYRDCFAQTLRELGRTNLAEMTIDLTTDQPVRLRPYRLSYAEREVVRKKIAELLGADIVEESSSPYASPLLIVKKKNGDERICIDFRAINKISRQTPFPLPLIDDQLDRLQGCAVFTSLDLASGYYQVPLETTSREKTAFVTPDGHFQFKVMPFGLTNAPAVFQALINKVLGPLRYTIALAYMDDILIPTKDIETGFRHLEEVLQALRSAKLTLNLKKCHFFQERIDYLGYEISAVGIQPGAFKIKAVEDFPRPENVHDLRRFLGLASYFRRFVRGFAEKAAPLNLLLRKKSEWKWTETQERAFQELRSALVQRPVLRVFDPAADTELHTDASGQGLGAMLLQRGKDGQLHPISYASRCTTAEEGRYHSYEQETLAVVWGVQKFRHYLMGRKFKVVTDCNSVRHALTKRNMIPRIARWWLRLQEYCFDIEHRPGSKMAHVDSLSRAPFAPPEEEREVIGLDILHMTVTTEDWLLTAQRQDDRIQRIREQLTKTDDITADDERVRTEYAVHADRVYKRVLQRNGEESFLWVVPERVRWRIVKTYHDDIGHVGVDKTVAKIAERFWFPRMRRYVKRYISSCMPCLYHKKPAGRQMGFLHPIERVDVPFDTIHVDHLGPFVRSLKGNRHLIVAVCAFSKFVILKAVRDAGMSHAAKFLQDIIGLFGAPRRVISDRGVAYAGKAFEKVCHAAGIMHVKTATATPRGNGQVERLNRVLSPALAASCQRDDEKDWDEAVPQIQWGINNTKHKVTGHSPFSLVFGYTSRSPTGAYLEDEVETPWKEEARRRRAEALQAISRSQEQQKQRYDQHRAKPHEYQIGDLVLVEREPVATGDSRKMAAKYRGPYVISRKLKFDRYEVQDLPENRRTNRFYTGIAPVDKLKLWTVGIQDEGEVSASDSETEEQQAGQESRRIRMAETVSAP